MKWKQKKNKHGDIRIIKKFASLPITINGETRWLEWVIVKQEYTTLLWIDKEFIEEEQIEKLKEELNKSYVHEAKEKVDKEMEYEFKEGKYKGLNK